MPGPRKTRELRSRAVYGIAIAVIYLAVGVYLTVQGSVVGRTLLWLSPIALGLSVWYVVKAHTIARRQAESGRVEYEPDLLRSRQDRE